MPTVKELIESIISERKAEYVNLKVVEENNEKRDEEKAIKKLNKVDRLRKFCKDGKRVGFIAYTPGTESGRKFHCVNMIQSKVEKTKEGNFVIVGYDVELTLTKMVENGVDISKRVMFSKIKPEYKVYRCYRVDRILDGTITHE